MLNNLPWQDKASQPRSTNPNKIDNRNALSTTALNVANNLTPHNALRAFHFAKKQDSYRSAVNDDSMGELLLRINELNREVKNYAYGKRQDSRLCFLEKN